VTVEYRWENARQCQLVYGRIVWGGLKKNEKAPARGGGKNGKRQKKNRSVKKIPHQKKLLRQYSRNTLGDKTERHAIAGGMDDAVRLNKKRPPLARAMK